MNILKSRSYLGSAMKSSLLLIVSFVLCSNILANDNQRYRQVDKIARKIPDSLTYSTSDIANYLMANLNGDDELARGAFIWIANNIDYDLSNIFSVNTYQDAREVIDEVLSKRKGVCMHFAQLYHEITTKAGLESVIINGYTTVKSYAVYVPHSWCAVSIDSSWYLVDPVWGSGYIQKKVFYKDVDNFYFKSDPWKLIKTHMPFDPVWQLVYYPITNHDFHSGKTYINTRKPLLYYNDTIEFYHGKPEIERLIASNRRIEKNGLTNHLIIERLRYTKRLIEYYRYQKNNEDYQLAEDIYNQGVRYFKEYIEYRNSHFIPEKPFNEIYQMLVSAESCFMDSSYKLDCIKESDSSTQELIVHLNNSIEDAIKSVDELKGYLEEYKKAKQI